MLIPASSTVKLVVALSLVIAGTVGFVGNSLSYYFISSKSKANPYLQPSPFIRNFNFCVKSLALSDILSSTMSLPLVYTELTVNLFQSDWPCKVVRCLNMLFPSIAMNNLIAIRTEKNFSTLAVLRSFTVASVRRLVVAARIGGFLIVVAPTGAFNGIRFELDNTHYYSTNCNTIQIWS